MYSGSASVQLYCDNKNCPDRDKYYSDGFCYPAEYHHDRSVKKCEQEAKSDGWYISRDYDYVLCPKCSKKKESVEIVKTNFRTVPE